MSSAPESTSKSTLQRNSVTLDECRDLVQKCHDEGNEYTEEDEGVLSAKVDRDIEIEKVRDNCRKYLVNELERHIAGNPKLSGLSVEKTAEESIENVIQCFKSTYSISKQSGYDVTVLPSKTELFVPLKNQSDMGFLLSPCYYPGHLGMEMMFKVNDEWINFGRVQSTVGAKLFPPMLKFMLRMLPTVIKNTTIALQKMDAVGKIVVYDTDIFITTIMAYDMQKESSTFMTIKPKMIEFAQKNLDLCRIASPFVDTTELEKEMKEKSQKEEGQ